AELLVHLRELERAAHRLLVPREAEEPLHHFGALLEMAVGLEQPRKRRQRADVVRVALEHGAISVDRAPAVLETRLVDVAEAHLEAELGREIAPIASVLDLAREQVREVLV